MSWVLTVLRGAVALALGIAVLVAGSSVDQLDTFIALYFILAGLAALRSAGTGTSPGRARLRRFAGILAIVFAVVVLFRELLASAIPDSVVLTLLGLGSVGIGSIRLVGGFAEEGRSRHRPPATDIALGIAELVLGVALVIGNFDRIWPAIAVWGLVGGTALLLDARRERHGAMSQAPRTDFTRVKRGWRW